jgi:ATP-dependent RNA helicase DDX55/SPB4
VQPYPHLFKKEESEQAATKLTNNIQSLIRQDRDLYESSVKAFVSFIRCYKKHEARFIFREQDLDFGKVASSFALLRLPRMPEIDRWRKEHKDEADAFDGEDDIKMDTFAYADKAREKQRLEGLEKRKLEKANEDLKDKSLKAKKKMRGAVASETAWSHQKAQKDKKEERKEKKTRKREFERRLKKEQVQVSKANKGDEQDDEIDDWAQDEREAKKARKAAVVTGTTFDDL